MRFPAPHCNLTLRISIASDLRFHPANAERKSRSFCGISLGLKGLAMENRCDCVLRFWCAQTMEKACLAHRLCVLKRSVPKTLAFVFGLRLRSKTQRSKTRVVRRRLPNGKPHERLRFWDLCGQTPAFKKRIAIISCVLGGFP